MLYIFLINAFKAPKQYYAEHRWALQNTTKACVLYMISKQTRPSFYSGWTSNIYLHRYSFPFFALHIPFSVFPICVAPFSLSLSLSLLTSSLDPRKNKRVKTRQMNLQGALDEKYIRIYVAHETTACNTWPLFRSNIFLANMELLGHTYRVTFIIPFIYHEI